MATVPSPATAREINYPTSDGKPMAETDWHRNLMVALIEILRAFFAGQRVYVSGNLLVFYEQGNRRRHISPDVFVVRGVEHHDRPNYLIWQEGRGPEVAIELTSSTTRRQDQTTKRDLYQNVLRVREYFLFDPLGDYLDPPMQGYRLRQGVYHPIRAVRGRLPSQVLGLHLERAGQTLRLWNPLTQTWLPTAEEARQQAEQRAEQEAQRAEQEAQRAEQEAQRAEQEAQRAEREAQRVQQVQTENNHLRQELEELRRRLQEQK